MSVEPTRVTCTIELDTEGKHVGVLNVPYSRDDSAWGALRIPIVVIKHGQGPTLMLVGGNHGDEYEGPIALTKLARTLHPASIQGRLIILPALNLPAVLAGTRVSPVDQVNMNRAFPGDPRGRPTLMIADYVERYLLPHCDAVLDLHAGGKTLTFLPLVGMHILSDKPLMERTMAAARAFDAPIGLIIEEFDTAGMLDTAVEDRGRVFLFTELGGGGTATAETVRLAERGIWNLLRHFDLVEGEPELDGSRLMHSPDSSFFVVSDDRGILEMLVDVGTEIERGQPIAQIHDVEKPGAEPVLYRAGQSGLLLARHHPGLVKSGDCLAVIATDYPDG